MSVLSAQSPFVDELKPPLVAILLNCISTLPLSITSWLYSLDKALGLLLVQFWEKLIFAPPKLPVVLPTVKGNPPIVALPPELPLSVKTCLRQKWTKLPIFV